MSLFTVLATHHFGASAQETQDLVVSTLAPVASALGRTLEELLLLCPAPTEAFDKKEAALAITALTIYAKLVLGKEKAHQLGATAEWQMVIQRLLSQSGEIKNLDKAVRQWEETVLFPAVRGYPIPDVTRNSEAIAKGLLAASREATEKLLGKDLHPKMDIHEINYPEFNYPNAKSILICTGLPSLTSPSQNPQPRNPASPADPWTQAGARLYHDLLSDIARDPQWRNGGPPQTLEEETYLRLRWHIANVAMDSKALAGMLPGPEDTIN